LALPRAAARARVTAMYESLAPLRDPRLRQLVIDIRCILMQPTQNHRKLAEIERAVDELAPPPGPEG
jgi:hypothetical protein